MSEESAPKEPIVSKSLSLEKKTSKFPWFYTSIGFLIVVVLIVGGALFFTNLLNKDNTSTVRNSTTPPASTSEKQTQTVVSNSGLVYSKGSDIYSVKIDGTDSKKIASFQNGGYGRSLKVSPDLKKVAYTKDFNIWVVNLDGTNPYQVSTIGRDATDQFMEVDTAILGWNTEGSKILLKVFATPPCTGDCGPNTPSLTEDSSVKYGVYYTNIENPKNTFVSNQSDEEYVFLGWPKGRDPVFFKNINNDDLLYFLNLTDGTFRKISDQKFPGLFLSGGHTSFSSDGNLFTWIGASANGNSGIVGVPENSSQVYLANLDGTNQMKISSIGNWADYQRPRFVSGDRYISYKKNADVYLFDTLTKKTELIAQEVYSAFVVDPNNLFVERVMSVLAGPSLYRVDLKSGKETLIDQKIDFDAYNVYSNSL